MITNNSRYLEDTVTRVTESGATRSIIVRGFPRTEVIDFTYYQWQEGDRIDRIAEDFFDDGGLWYVIADANPEYLLWHAIPVGTVIRIPSG